MLARSSAIIGVVAVAVSLAVSAPSISSAAGPVTGPVGAVPSLEWVSLITGDQVAVDAGGKLLAVRPALGRERIRLSVYGSGSHLYVVPADAAALVEKGAVDRRLFDVALLARPEYRRQNADGLAVIVAYRDRQPRAIDGTRVEYSYTSLNGEGLTVTDPAVAWSRLTTDPAVKKIWLDAVPADTSNARE